MMSLVHRRKVILISKVGLIMLAILICCFIFEPDRVSVGKGASPDDENIITLRVVPLRFEVESASQIFISIRSWFLYQAPVRAALILTPTLALSIVHEIKNRSALPTINAP